MATPYRAVFGLQGDFDEATAAETGAAEAQILTLTVDTSPGFDGLEFTYAAAAEDGGIVGAHDLTPGVIYEGQPETYREFAIEVTNLDVTEGAISVHEAGDEVTAVLYLNSQLVAVADEGFVSEFDNESAAVEFNIEAVVRMTDTDVLRIGLLSPAGTETVDWDVAEGGEWIIS